MPNSDYTLADFSTIDNGRADFISLYTQFLETVDTLNSQLKGSLAEWTGSAQTAYYHAKTVWDNAATDMGNVINALGGVAGTSAENFVNTENHNQRLWA